MAHAQQYFQTNRSFLFFSFSFSFSFSISISNSFFFKSPGPPRPMMGARPTLPPPGQR